MKTKLLFPFHYLLISGLCLALVSGCDRPESFQSVMSSSTGEVAPLSASPPPMSRESARVAPGATTVSPLKPAILEMVRTNTAGIIEARIHFVESWGISEGEKAQVYFSMLAGADDEDQRKLAHAATRQVSAPTLALLRDHLLDPQWPRPVLSVFLTDTLKRPNHQRIPMLLALAQTAEHPMQAEAKELLTVYFGQNHGNNWQQWEETMLAFLEKNPN